MGYRIVLRLIGIIIILVIAVDVETYTAQAQEPENWSLQQQIPDITAQQRQIILITDQNNKIHAFNHQLIDDTLAVLYLTWTLDNGWSEPIDILLPPIGQNINILDTFLDKTGSIHAVLQSNGSIYYTRAPLIEAGRASAWLKPDLVSENARAPFNAEIAGNDRNLVIVFSGSSSGQQGVSSAFSVDQGQTWSDPETFFMTYEEELAVVDAQVFLGESGNLHTVWAVANNQGLNVAGYYAQLNIQNKKWSDPIELDESLGLGIANPTVIEHGGEVFVLYYNGGKSNANWWRKSSDFGSTWSPPRRLSHRHEGANGSGSFVIDSNNMLHVLFAQRTLSQIHGLWHSVWQGDQWTDAEPVVSGRMSQVEGEEFDPHSASAVISQGNLLFVTWTTDAQIAVDDIWYAYKFLDTPKLPVVTLPTVQTVTKPSPTVTPTFEPEATPLPHRAALENVELPSTSMEVANPAIPIAVGLIPVLLILAIVIGIQKWR